MLRRVLIAYGVFCLVVAAVLLIVVHAALAVVIYLVVNGLVITGAVVFERGRYRPRARGAGGRWELTGERFVDPSTGKTMEVRYNPDTGQRDYVPAGHNREIWRRDDHV